MKAYLLILVLVFILMCEYLLVVKGKNSSITFFGLFVVINGVVYLLNQSKAKNELKRLTTCTVLGLVGLLLLFLMKTHQHRVEFLVKMIALFIFIYS
jgi:hypothetical protein